MKFLVNSVKAIVELCSRKDFSHLEDKFIQQQIKFYEFSGSYIEEQLFGEEESDPVSINQSICSRSSRPNVLNNIKLQRVTSETDEENSSTEEEVKHVRNLQKKKKRRRKTSQPMKWCGFQEDQLIFRLDM